ncbi:hypothetical protein QVD17_26052 [Tagetes erecta]|uniref:Uncharacterized protein n=1 Tax=Tagetes erecta TaxID=13708 RepID=A0AAD8K874_TARER|nr:hypothetical protein QVD17_26052 [Tagetes erecta]
MLQVKKSVFRKYFTLSGVGFIRRFVVISIKQKSHAINVGLICLIINQNFPHNYLFCRSNQYNFKKKQK